MTDQSEQQMSAEIEAMSFEAALSELEQVVAKLETGQATLDDSIALYTRGNLLRAHCEKRLKAAEARIEKITLDSNGQPQARESFDSDAS